MAAMWARKDVLPAPLLARMVQALASHPAFVISVALVAEVVPFTFTAMSAMASSVVFAVFSMVPVMVLMVFAQIFVMWGAVSA